MEAIALYRAQFRPSAQLARPYVMLGFQIYAADSSAQAQLLATSMQQAFVNLRSGRPSRLAPPVADYLARCAPHERAMLDQVLSCAAIGTAAEITTTLRAFIARTAADELIIASQVFDQAARLHSYEIAAQVMQRIGQPGN